MGKMSPFEALAGMTGLSGSNSDLGGSCVQIQLRLGPRHTHHPNNIKSQSLALSLDCAYSRKRAAIVRFAPLHCDIPSSDCELHFTSVIGYVSYHFDISWATTWTVPTRLKAANQHPSIEISYQFAFCDEKMQSKQVLPHTHYFYWNMRLPIWYTRHMLQKRFQ